MASRATVTAKWAIGVGLPLVALGLVGGLWFGSATEREPATGVSPQVEATSSDIRATRSETSAPPITQPTITEQAPVVAPAVSATTGDGSIPQPVASVTTAATAAAASLPPLRQHARLAGDAETVSLSSSAPTPAASGAGAGPVIARRTVTAVAPKRDAGDANPAVPLAPASKAVDVSSFRLTPAAPRMAAGSNRSGMIAYEGFDYAANQVLQGLDGGIGWATAWTKIGTDDDATVTSPGMSFANHDSTGLAARFFGGDSKDITYRRRMAATLGADGTSVWVGFLMREDKNNLNSRFSLRSGGSLAFGLDRSGHNDWRWVDPTSNQSLGVAKRRDEVVFWLMRIDFEAGDDTVNLWHNWTDLTTEPSDPATHVLTVDDFSFDGVQLYSNGVTWDEVRVGWTFGDVIGAGDPDPGLVLSYNFDFDTGTTIKDYSGNGNDGSLHDGATLLGGGGSGVALFDGDNDRISVGTPASLDLTGDMTLSAWVLPRDLDPNSWSFHNVIARGYYLNAERSIGSEIFLRIYRGQAQLGHWYGDYMEDLAQTPITANRPVHLAGIHDTAYDNGDGTTGAWLLYVDGVLRDVAPSTQNPQSTPAEWAIGGRVPTGIAVAEVDRSFDGQIDEPRIYSRALSASEVADLHAEGADDFAPMVDAGGSLAATATAYPASVPLTAIVVDDGSSPLSYAWTAADGASIASGGATATPEASVPGPGSYTFTVTVSDAAHSVSDSVVVTVSTVASTAVLAAHYDFDGVGAAVEDRVGTSDGIATNLIKQTSSDGQVGLFDGTASVAIGDPAALDIAGAITLTAWVLREGKGFGEGGTQGVYVGRRYPAGAPSAERGWVELSIFGNNHQVESGSASGSVRARTHKGGNLSRWQHLAASYSSIDGRWRLYLDGALATEVVSPIGASGDSGSWLLGARSIDGVLRDHFGGALEDVRIYQGALDQTAIRRLVGTPPGNMTPVVRIDPPTGVTANTIVDLGGSVFDDTASLAGWSVVSAPVGASVVFDDATDAGTAASFSDPGDYTLRLDAVDEADPGIGAGTTVTLSVTAPAG